MSHTKKDIVGRRDRKKMSNHYKDAIELLKNLSPEKSKEIIFEIAKSNPSAIVKAMPENVERKPHQIEWQCRELIHACVNKRKINAIKALKTVAGLGLKEAKDIIDEFM